MAEKILFLIESIIVSISFICLLIYFCKCEKISNTIYKYYVEDKKAIDFIINQVKKNVDIYNIITDADNLEKTTRITIKIKKPIKQEYEEKQKYDGNDTCYEFYKKIPIVDEEKQKEIIENIHKCWRDFKVYVPKKESEYIYAVTFIDFRQVSENEYINFNGYKYIESRDRK